LALPAPVVCLNVQWQLAARENDLSQVADRVDRGAAVDSRNRPGKTARLLACEKGNAAMVAVLTTAEADINLVSVELVTPLMAASYAGNAVIVHQLIAAGARLHSVDRMNKSAAIYAAGQGHAAVLGSLIDAGIDVNATYAHRLTLLLWPRAWVEPGPFDCSWREAQMPRHGMTED
jgi:ankyrin repeat protein